MKYVMVMLGLLIISTLVMIGCSEEPVKKNEPRICTMEWAPVCGIDNNTYSNSCMAGEVEIAYEGECIR